MEKYKVKESCEIIPQDDIEEDTFDHYERRPADLVAYWVLGFGNNFTYWVLITAAYDLIMKDVNTDTISINEPSNNTIFGNYSTVANSTNNEHVLCLPQSTGMILVADTVPAAIVTSLFVFVKILSTNFRVILLLFLCFCSYLVLGLAPAVFTLPGVALASLSRGFSDVTFLSFAAYYHKDVLSLWSSGTGVATFIGPLLYSGLTTMGINSSTALLSFLTVPISSGICFWWVLGPPQKHRLSKLEICEEINSDEVNKTQKNIKWRIQNNLYLYFEALQHTLPLSFFYFIMYLTNQGMVDLVYFPESSLTHSQQYSWINTARGLGTLISRSSHHLMLLPNRWMYNVIIVLVLFAVLGEVLWQYLSTVYLIMILLLLQGMIEGAVFRHTIYRLSSEKNEKKRNFFLGIFPSSLFLPAVAAGLIALPVHSIICQFLETS